MLNSSQLKTLVKKIKKDALYNVLTEKGVVIDKYFMEFLMVQDESRKMNSEEIFNMRGQIMLELVK
jgi:hypothetical protein